MRKRYSRSYTVLSFLTMLSYRELPSDCPFLLLLFIVEQVEQGTDPCFQILQAW